jgi:ankyrin repeat protein
MLSRSQIDELFSSCQRGDIDFQRIRKLSALQSLRNLDNQSILDVAILHGHTELVRNLLSLECFLEEFDDQVRAMESAAKCGDVSMVALLRDSVVRRCIENLKSAGTSNVGPSATWIYNPAFRLACENGNLDVVRWFIAHVQGLALNASLRESWSKGYLDIVRALIAAGANLHHVLSPSLFIQVVNESSRIWADDPQRGDRDELLDLLISTNCYLPLNTMPLWMCLSTSLQLLKQVLAIAAQSGPAPELKQKRLMWVAKAACSCGNVEVLDHVLAVASHDGLTMDENSMFFIAIGQGQREIAELLYTRSGCNIDRFFNPDKHTADALSPDLALACAAACDSQLITRAILAMGAGINVNAVQRQSLSRGAWEWGAPPYTALSKASDVGVIGDLLAAGAAVNPEACDTVLRGACEKLRLDAVKMLLDAKADVNRRGSSEPALFHAVYAEHRGMVEDKIALINLLFDSGASARDIVEGKSILHQHGQVTQMTALQHDWVPVLHLLLARDPGLLECRDQEGQTPLISMVAAPLKYPWFVKALLDAGADANAVDDTGASALFHFFVVKDIFYGLNDNKGMREILQMLLHAGVNPTVCGAGGETLLMHAIERPGSGDPRIRAMDLPGRSVSDVACSVFMGDILDSIIDAGADDALVGDADDCAYRCHKRIQSPSVPPCT